MSLKKLFRLPSMLIFRLTLWYSGIFSVFIVAAFIFLNLLVNSILQEELERALTNEADGISNLLARLDSAKTDLVLENLSWASNIIFIRTIDADGNKFTSQYIYSEDIGVNRKLLRGFDITTGDVFETLSIHKSPHKVRVIYRMIDPNKILQIGMPVPEAEELLGSFQKVFGIIMVLVILFASLISWLMAKHALSGVEEVTKTAMHIYNGEYDSRVPITGNSKEIDNLSITFNKMLERIQALIYGMKEMTDNIAHDLKSPITRIRGIAETTMITAKSNSDYELMTGSIIEECDRLLGIINMMLDISEAEAGISKLNKSKLDSSMLVEEACELFQPIADDKEIKITLKPGNNKTIYGDEQKLQRVVANLLDNAVKYSPTKSTVTVDVSGNGTEVNITIKDNGIGISSEDLPHIFKRFYRCDSTRSRPGAGLGLSWAQAIIQAHGGNIFAMSTPNEGSTFTVTIPNF